jgi:hypothetical protein
MKSSKSFVKRLKVYSKENIIGKKINSFKDLKKLDLKVKDLSSFTTKNCKKIVSTVSTS